MNQKINQAVILAGGYGTRLKPFTDTNPKPMFPIENKPFLEYIIEQIKSFEIDNILILLGYKPEKIMSYFQDGFKWNINITYSITPVEYETGLRIKEAKDLMENKFLLLYCDNYCPVDFKVLEDFYQKNDALLQFTAYKNSDNYTNSNLKIADDGLVEVYDKKRIEPNLQGVDIGYAIVDKSVLSLIPDENCNFEAVAYPELVKQKKLYAYVTEHRYYSIGSWERIELTKEFFKPKRFIFLDRDGTLNKRPPKACYIEKPDEFIWLEGAKEAIKLLNDENYNIILITNQPGIARGNLTEDMLQKIHTKMNNDLNEINAHIKDIYYCPHNWDENCECRKPKPGMFYQAQKDYSLDLSKCIIIGDDERDIEAGTAAGCKCILIDEKYTLLDAVKSIIGDNKKCI